MITESIDSKSARADGFRAVTPSYVLITPARNEAAFIELTLKSVVAQTAKPLRWVIVSDGSTDGTDDIVKRYAAQHPWIELVRMPERKERHFAGKVHAFNAGYVRLKDLDYDIIGNLDADITFDADYLGFLLSKFQQDDTLGVAGTPFREGSFQYDYRFVSSDHVSGACQLFRRACFEAVGGYTPLPRGVDLIAVTSARMKGWKTRCFMEKYSHHHRKQGTGMHKSVMVVYWSGYYDYVLGVHPLWQLVRSVYEMRLKPYFIGGCCMFGGYFWAMITQVERPVSSELVAFRKKEQMARLRLLIGDMLTLRWLRSKHKNGPTGSA